MSRHTRAWGNDLLLRWHAWIDITQPSCDSPPRMSCFLCRESSSPRGGWSIDGGSVCSGGVVEVEVVAAIGGGDLRVRI